MRGGRLAPSKSQSTWQFAHGAAASFAFSNGDSPVRPTCDNSAGSRDAADRDVASLFVFDWIIGSLRLGGRSNLGSPARYGHSKRALQHGRRAFSATPSTT